MPLGLDHFKSPFRLVWSMIGRSLVVDQNDRQVVRPSNDIGSIDWYTEKADWERLAPIMAGAPELYAVSERLAEKLEGDRVRIVDGRITLEPIEVEEFLDVLAEIRAGAPKISSSEEKSEPADDQSTPRRYLR